MPVQSVDLAEQVESWATSVLDSIADLLAKGVDTLDPDQLAERLRPAIADIMAVVSDLGAAAPRPGEEFLAPDGQPAGPNQMTVQDFAAAVVTALMGAGTLPPGLPPLTPADTAPLTSGITGLLEMCAPLIDPEMYVRWILKIQGVANATDVAQALAEAIGKNIRATMKATTANWPADVPQLDSTKDAEEGPLLSVPLLGMLTEHILMSIPGGRAPNNAAIGREVHRRILARYADDHPDHLVVNDGRVRFTGVGSEQLVVSEIWDATGAILTPSVNMDRLACFWLAMRNPVTGRRIHPDIADLHTKATGTDPDDDWGWFEIKPMHDARRAFDEVYGYYLRKWNYDPMVRSMAPDWDCGPGTWQPGTIEVLPKYRCVFAAVTIFPGVIGYVTYDLEADAKVAVAAALAALASLFNRKLLRSLQQGVRGVEVVTKEILEYLATVALCVTLLVILVFAAAALLEVTVLALLAELAALLARLLALGPVLAPS
ncbi:hypothetical protein ACIBSW_35000 [Actinoplanes sp. NPDC049668]|uniref:hypothetical protein n=1 Tax=unclassified Actinoplanes TaxID=2626549 RepID=UPI0033AF215B